MQAVQPLKLACPQVRQLIGARCQFGIVWIINPRDMTQLGGLAQPLEIQLTALRSADHSLEQRAPLLRGEALEVAHAATLRGSKSCKPALLSHG